MTMVRNEADAEDILQQAKLVMWRAFGQFTPGTNFSAWARKIILNQVLTYRKKQKRDRLWFNDDILLLVAEEVEESNEALERQQAALKECVTKLSPDHQNILQQRYFGRQSIEDIASASQRARGRGLSVVEPYPQEAARLHHDHHEKGGNEPCLNQR